MDTTLVPFRQFVLKMHSRCDLACDHCYIYEHADSSWRGRPKASSDEVLARTAERIAEHARAHGLKAVHVVLHGGEPLLAGLPRLRRAAEELSRALAGVCALDLRIHTNGVLLDERFCDLFAEYGIKVGISLDGDKAANDLHRRYADGRSSHAKVLKAIALLNRPHYRHLYAGLLCTIDVRNDPIAVYDALMALDPPHVDFLLPHATWDEPPLRPDGARTPYADWLAAVFERWDAQGRQVPVRIFDSVLRTLRGLNSLTESLGLDPADLVVIDTDGTIEQADSLKTAFDGAAATGFDIFTHDLDTAARHPGMIDRQHGLEGLCAQCRSCPVVESCGGGLYAHRYHAGTGFDNPSVFCPDLLELVTHIKERTVPAQSEAVPDPAPLTDDQLQELAAGYGSTGTVRALAESQLDLSRELLSAVFDRAGRGSEVRAAWGLITELDVEAPEALDPVLAHPYTRAWALRCLQPEGGGPAADAGGIAEIAAAAAVLAGQDRGVVVPVRGGLLRLPTLGAVLLDGASEALVTAEPGGFTVRSSSGEVLRIRQDDEADPRWQPVRHCELPGWRVALEDTDPQRDAHLHPVAGRLSSAEAAAWRSGLAEAWHLLGRTLPGYTEGVAAGLSTITPLAAAPAGRSVSAAARQAFGAVGIAHPQASDLLALLVIHEFQHVKLGAVLDLYDLFDPADTKPRFFPPWRPDPRPLEGLLQGTYAHVAVAEYWRSRRLDLMERGAPAEQVEQAAEQFDTWRWHTAKAVEDVAGSGSLTELGQRFAAGMRATVAPWLDEPCATRPAGPGPAPVARG
ncbi:FxsB family cyclophane-forming radical SAM/SPASM peptide maturase [Streptacidiphilus sp. PAMC 29251]